jgi:hypothetical protein
MTGSDTITDAIVAGSGSGEVADSIQASRRDKKDRFSVFASPTPAGTCSNCATVLSGPVCHSCGQTSDTYHRPIWDLLLDILDGLFGLEGRLWRTLPALMFRPGKLTLQYLSGVRARYVMPFRLYLTASVLFFLAFSLVNGGSGVDTEGEAPPADLTAAREALESGELESQLDMLPTGARAAILQQVERELEAAGNASDAIPPEVAEMQSQAERDEMKRRIRIALLPELYPDEIAARAEEGGNTIELEDGTSISFDAVAGWPLAFRQRLADGAAAIIDSEGEALWTAMKTWAPRLMFVLLPIYALLLAVTHFYKRGLFFYDHLVVSLHFHAFLFFMFLLLGLVSLTIGAGWAILIFFLWSNYYLYRLHRTVYDHGRFSSAARVVLLDFVYMMILGFGFVLLMLVGVLTSAG